MDPFSWITSILNVLSILGIIAGLWIAGKIIPTVIIGIHSESHYNILSHPLAKTILWLALGSLLSFPLIDLISWIGNLVNVTLVPQAGGGFSTFLGMIPPRVYLLFPLLLMLAVYGITSWVAMGFLSTSGRFNHTERIFIVFSIASLVYRGIHTIFTQVFSFQIPIINVQQNYGVPGFLFELLIGLVILTLILIGLNKVLPTHPASSK